MSATEPLRDSQGRLASIHGLVLDDGNPAPTLRELLRQWSETATPPPGDLPERTAEVLRIIGPDGTATRPGQSTPPTDTGGEEHPGLHEFAEDANDGSMCVCGIPALTHDSVYPPTTPPTQEPT